MESPHLNLPFVKQNPEPCQRKDTIAQLRAILEKFVLSLDTSTSLSAVMGGEDMKGVEKSSGSDEGKIVEQEVRRGMSTRRQDEVVGQNAAAEVSRGSTVTLPSTPSNLPIAFPTPTHEPHLNGPPGHSLNPGVPLTPWTSQQGRRIHNGVLEFRCSKEGGSHEWAFSTLVLFSRLADYGVEVGGV